MPGGEVSVRGYNSFSHVFFRFMVVSSQHMDELFSFRFVFTFLRDCFKVNTVKSHVWKPISLQQCLGNCDTACAFYFC